MYLLPYEKWKHLSSWIHTSYTMFIKGSEMRNIMLESLDLRSEGKDRKKWKLKKNFLNSWILIICKVDTGGEGSRSWGLCFSPGLPDWWGTSWAAMWVKFSVIMCINEKGWSKEVKVPLHLALMEVLICFLHANVSNVLGQLPQALYS